MFFPHTIKIGLRQAVYFFLIALTPLLAQNYDIATSQKELEQRLASCEFNGGLFFYDVPGGQIQAAINTAYSRNPEIFDRVAFRAFATPNYPYFMPALAGMTGHPIEPRWFVVDKRKNPVFSSKDVPTEDEILKQLDYAGIQKRSTVFRGYLRDNPGRDDALMKLFYHQYEMAIVKLRKHLTENGWDRTPFPAPELLRPLTSRADGYRKTDDTEWGILGPLVEALLATGETTEADRIFEEFMEKIPSAGIQSKLVQLANKWEKQVLAIKWQGM
ncbi:MAG: hypothetical protein FWG02_05990 [Holophagaceae bacterium]|nr:hypothetical protein [Holophagaceae bacterium]